jgi:hypothetical protein
MKLLLLLDNKIREDQLATVKKEVAAIYKTNTGITLEFVEEWRDFSNVPKEWYDASSEGIKKSYIADATREIYRRHTEAVDQVVFFIHRDNWNLTGVWGWNLSKAYNGYGVQQCRFDNRNLANTVGTLYHELMHDHDTFIYTYKGINIETILKVKDWDDDVVHGGKYSGTTYGYGYIRHNENQAALKQIGPLLSQAIEERRKLYLKRQITMLQEIVRLQQLVIVLKRQMEARSRGDIAIRPRCLHTNH